MPHSFRLQSLLDLSQLRLDEASRRLGELISGEQEAAKRLQLLIEYRSEYQARFVAASQTGLGPREWQNFRGFLQRLDDAVNQAETLAAQSRQRTASGQKEWIAKRGKVKAFDTLAQRHQMILDHHEIRREQKASDEHTARRHGRDDTSEEG